MIGGRRLPLGVRAYISPRADAIIGLSGIGVLVAIWCFLTYGGFVRPLFLPTPSSMWTGLTEFNNREWLIPAVLHSLGRVSISLALVTIVGVPIGILMGAFTPIDAFLQKIVNGAKSIPTTGLVGLIVIWFGIEESGKVAYLFIGAIFYMVIMVKNATLAVPPEYVKVALDLGANRRQIIGRVLLPGALPQIWEAIALCNGIMWTYIVLVEYISSNEQHLGLGYLLSIGSHNNESGKVFAVLAVIAVISSSTDYLLHWIHRRFLNW